MGPKRRRMNCLKDDVAGKNVTGKMTSDRKVLKKTCCADTKKEEINDGW